MSGRTPVTVTLAVKPHKQSSPTTQIVGYKRCSFFSPMDGTPSRLDGLGLADETGRRPKTTHASTLDEDQDQPPQSFSPSCLQTKRSGFWAISSNATPRGTKPTASAGHVTQGHVRRQSIVPTHNTTCPGAGTSATQKSLFPALA